MRALEFSWVDEAPDGARSASRHYDGQDLDVRDPKFIREQSAALELICRYYFRARVRGLDAVPRRGPVIFVGNHSGGLSTPDSLVAAQAMWTTFGAERPIYALSQRQVFHLPIVNRHLMRIGCLAATARVAHRVLAAGASMLIYPGAGHEAYRPFWRGHKVDLNGRSAYVRLALRYGVPIVPVVSFGGHNTLLVLDDGRALVKALRLDQIGLERIPLTFQWPQGLVLGLQNGLPLPARIDVDFGGPITFAGFGRDAARDPATVRFCHDHVERTMQCMLDTLIDERKQGDPRRRTE